MINLTKPPGKDNPRGPIANGPETIKVPDGDLQISRCLIPPALGLWQAIPRTGARGPLDRLAALAAAVRTTVVISSAWLAGLPRRLGSRWYAMNDEEARWHHWQVTETFGGLGRQYRDPRFDALKPDPTLRADRSGRPLNGGEGLCRPAVHTDQTTPA